MKSSVWVRIMVLGALACVSAPMFQAIESCPSYPNATLVYSPSSYSFQLMKPTTRGNLLACGTIGGSITDTVVYLEGDTVKFRLASGSWQDGTLTVTVDFGAGGSITYSIVGTSGQATVVSSTLSDCSQLENSPTRLAIIEAYEYYETLALGNVGTPVERAAQVALFELLGEYLSSTNLIESCAKYWMRPFECSSSPCENVLACTSCCNGELGGAADACYAIYDDSVATWWGWFKNLTFNSADNALKRCLARAEGNFNWCVENCHLQNQRELPDGHRCT